MDTKYVSKDWKGENAKDARDAKGANNEINNIYSENKTLQWKCQPGEFISL